MPAYISQNPYNGLAGIVPQTRQPYTSVQDAMVNRAIEREKIKSNNRVDSPIVDPVDFVIGAPMGLAKFGVTKVIPMDRALKAMAASGAYNTAEGAVLNSINSVPLSVADDVKDYYRMAQGLRRFPLR